MAAVLTILLATAKLHTFAVQWLMLMTTISLPAGIVLWTDYFVVCRRRWNEVKRVVNWRAFISWLIGSITIYYLNFVIQAWYSTLLSFLTTFAAYTAFSTLLNTFKTIHRK